MDPSIPSKMKALTFVSPGKIGLIEKPVSDATAHLALVPDLLSDEEVLMCPDIMSTGFGGSENGNIQKRGVDVAIEALGKQETFENCLRVLKPGGTLSSLGVYSKGLNVPLDAFDAGLGDHEIVTTLCPGGKKRMRRLLNIVESGRVDLKPLVTRRFKLTEIVKAYELFASQKDGVMKVAITPWS